MSRKVTSVQPRSGNQQIEDRDQKIRSLERQLQIRDEKILKLESQSLSLLKHNGELQEKLDKKEEQEDREGSVLCSSGQTGPHGGALTETCRNCYRLTTILHSLQNNIVTKADFDTFQRTLLRDLAQHKLVEKQDSDSEVKSKKEGSPWLFSKMMPTFSKQCDSCDQLEKEKKELTIKLQQQSERINSELSRYQGSTFSQEEAKRKFNLFFDESDSLEMVSTELKGVTTQTQVSFCENFMHLVHKVRDEIIDQIHILFQQLFHETKPSTDKDVWRAFSIMMQKVIITPDMWSCWTSVFGNYKPKSKRDLGTEAQELCTDLLLHVPPFIPTTELFINKKSQNIISRKEALKMTKGGNLHFLTPSLVYMNDVAVSAKFKTESPT